MKRVTVRLSDDDAEALRKAAKRTGHSQSELIREAVDRIVAASVRPRVFHSMGVGQSDGRPITHWDAEELYAKVMGRRRPGAN